MTKKVKYIAGILLTLVTCVSLTVYNGQKQSSTENAIQKDNIKPQEKDAEVDFPSKAIQIVVPYSPGGGTDSVARALADAAKNHFSQPIVVVNKTGDSGAVGMTEGANAKPDGYTVTVIPVELTTLPHLGLAAFTYRDFKPILQVNADPAALTVKANAPWNTVKEFMEYARRNPGRLKIGNSGEGAIWNLAAKGIERELGVKFNHIPFEGAAPAAVALLGGFVDAVTVSPAEVINHVKNRELKILGVLSSERVKTLPVVPTFKELGYDIEIGTWRGLGVPKDTPDEIVNILEEGFSKAAQEAYFKDIMAKLGLGYKVSYSNEFKQVIIESDEMFKALIKELSFTK